MTVCGSSWQPIEINRSIQAIHSSTKVVKVMTDAGIGYLKGMGNPQGDQALSCELVGTELAHMVGLNTAPCAILDVCDIELVRADNGTVGFGPAFISKELIGFPGSGEQSFFKSWARPDDAALLAVLDTLICNEDRCPPPDALDPRPNWDNLFFTQSGQKFDLIAIDHTHCFSEGEIEEADLGPAYIENPRVFGAFPEHRSLITDEAVDRAISALEIIDARRVEEIVGSVPREWGPTKAKRDEWARAIVMRASWLQGNLYAALTRQFRLGLD
ncbi:hypothetical protein HXX25_05570 [Hyphobacterium sp. CCMP332]|uniref:HipA family kinase n=1 Tax=Hyphobacterium sp. CCMP332 TaxID=2749086 RepID=UPI00164EFF2A|nr:HipA family kinase [Hyphobacterium sp. CCMP332]QNL18861.1 hypothetical protein HXX25_05570 [Hyphobacterium sp. CCMP332]